MKYNKFQRSYFDWAKKIPGFAPAEGEITLEIILQVDELIRGRHLARLGIENRKKENRGV